MERNLMQGLWIPRRDLTDWKIELSNGQVATRQSPGPVESAEVELDSIGCLSTASIKLTRPRHPVFPAFSFTVKFSVFSRVLGWVPVALGFIQQASQDDREQYTLDVHPLEEINLGGYYDGSVVHNTLGDEPVKWNETNQAVTGRMLKRDPQASIGMDWIGRLILSTPQRGSPVSVSRAHFYNWKNKPDVVLPYLTASRWDGGPGWAKGEYPGRPRPPLTPKRVQDAEAPTITEVTRPAGMPIVAARELIVQIIKAEEVVNGTAPTDADSDPENGLVIDTASMPGFAVITQPLKEPIARDKFKRRIKANQYAAVVVLDPEAWYEGSSLPGQDTQDVKALQDALTLAQKTYALALDALGADDPLTAKELKGVQDAQTQFRLARAAQGEVHSTYEPLSAQLPIGLTAHDVGSGVITGATMWVSRLPWDDAAVGPPAEVNPDPDAPLDQGQDIEGEAIVHPLASPNTIQVFESGMQEYTDNADGKSWQNTLLTVKESYFRGPMAHKLAQEMDEAWRQTFDPDLPPEDAAPPSAEWDGRWYLHVALWWQAVATKDKQITGDWAQVNDLDRGKLLALTLGPQIRTRGRVNS